MVTVPAVLPVTMPEDEPTEATAALLLVQVPPPVASVNAVLLPMHTLVVPVITEGPEFTFTVVVALQPEGSV